MDTPFEFECAALGDGVVLVAFRGHERVSEPFRMRVYVSLPADAVPGKADVIGQPATLRIMGSDPAADPQPTHGLVAGMQVLDETAERALCEIELRPKLWFLGHGRHSRVFTELSVPDILEAVLKDAGLTDYELRLQSYDPEEHVCQYQESDLAFVSRLMEHEGICYFFEHSDSGHKLVIADHKSAHTASRGSPLHYHPVGGGDLGSDLFAVFAERRSLTESAVRLSDYDYQKPTLAVSGDGDVGGPSGATFVHHGIPTDAPGRAGKLAGIRREEALVRARTFEGRGQAYHLRAGALFEVDRHPRAAVNREYLCLVLDHRGNLGAKTPELARLVDVPLRLVYEARVTAIASDVQFRPALATPRPRVPNLDRATVDGPADSDYAQLDADGRYRVKAGFDESDNEGDKASVHVRMMQPHAGNPEGWHLPLRKGTEVMVGFVHGDPDRPIIAGAVPNAETPAVVTSSIHTRNIFHSGGDNVIDIEDEDGKQWIDVRSPTADSYLHLGEPHGATSQSPTHYVVLHTDADCRFEIAGYQDIRVGGKLTEEVTGTVTENYNTSQKSTISAKQSTTVMGDVTENYDTGHKTSVTDAVTELYLAGQKTDVTGGSRHEIYDTTQSTLVVGGATHTYDLQDMSVTGGASTQVYAGPKTVIAAGAVSFTFDSPVTQIYGPTLYVLPSMDWKVKGSGMFFTPSYQEINISHTATCGNVQRLTIPHTTVWNMKVGMSVLKFADVLFSFGFNGIKVEDALNNGGVFGLKVKMDNVFALRARGARLCLKFGPKKKGV